MKILLVEDNEINRIVARQMLQSEGHTVVEAHDGRQSVEAAKTTTFDLILMDISMPVMDGRTATRAIRGGDGASKDTAIVALTANAMVEEQNEFIADGMNGILTKPLARDALRDLLYQTAISLDASAPAMIDADHSAETRQVLGENAFLKLRSRFVHEVDDFQVWLGSVHLQDFQHIAGRAHKIAGSAAVFGANPLKKSLNAIEDAAVAGDEKAVRTGTLDFGALWEQTKSQLLS